MQPSSEYLYVQDARLQDAMQNMQTQFVTFWVLEKKNPLFLPNM